MIQWKSEKRKISELKPAEYNPRKASKKQFEDLKRSIEKFDLADPIIINQNNTVIGGHFHLKVLKEKGTEEADVRIPNRLLSKEEEQELNLRLNKNLGEWDFNLLVNFDEKLLVDIGFDSRELGRMMQIQPQLEDDTIPEVNKQPQTKIGHLYQLGVHRLMCGDSTKMEDIKKLMNDTKANMVFTDPPYGMKLNTDFSSAKSNLRMLRNKAIKGGRKYKNIVGDNEDFSPDLIKTVFLNFPETKEIFMWGADYYSEHLSDKNNGSWIVWDKRLEESGDRIYGSCFELCWSKNKHKREIVRIKWAGIFGIEKEFDKRRYHPAQKPVALSEWFLKQYGKVNDIVVDLYAGSGSTLIACEKTNRICYGMELDPQYCDVIIQRWQNYTGKKAKLL